MTKERKPRKRRTTSAEPRTLDEAAVLLLQLEPGQIEDLRVLSRGLRALAGEVGLPAVRTHAVAAADAVDAAIDLNGDAASAGLAAAGRALEAAMNAAEPAVSAGSAVTVVEAPAAVEEGDLMAWALEALAEIDAEEARLSTAPDRSVHGDAREAAEREVLPAAPASPAVAAAASSEADAVESRLPEDVDRDLLDSFVTESLDYLQGAEAALLELEANPGNVEAVNTIFRCFHTIKGTAGFLGLEQLSGLAHLAESLLSRVRDGDIILAGGYADLALQSADVLRAMVVNVRASLGGAPLRLPADFASLMAALRDPEAQVARAAAPVAAPAAAAGPGMPRAQDTIRPRPQGGADAWMRVRTDRVDRLVDTIGELVIAHSMIAQDEGVAAGRGDHLARQVAHAGKIVRELQDLSISMRMVPLKAQFQKLARVVRDVALRSGKRVEFITEGEDTEIDRNMVDIIGDPLIHMIRNAIDHGIEAPEERQRAGKPAAGTIRLSAFHAGGAVVVQLADDGRGLDRARILARAVERGLVEADRSPSEREMDALIFAPGFSTAEQVTDLSGRGVGMDVVRRSIESLRGHVDIESRSGEGCTFTMRLPLTLALTDGMLVRVGGERYIIPTTSIQMSFRPEAEMLSTVVGRGEIVMLRGDVLPIVRLHRLFGVGGAVHDPTAGLLVVIAAGEQRCALLIDELLGQQQVVTKSLGAGIGKVGGLAGGAILGDGRVGLIIDPGEIIGLSRSGALAGIAA